MEENEQLRRQIRLLQGLIDDHKNVHGNAPVPQPPVPVPRWGNPRPPAFNNQTAFSARYSQQTQRDFQPPQRNSWRKKYSLVNVPPRPALNPSIRASASDSQVVLSQGNSRAAERQLMLSERRVGISADGNITVGLQTSLVAPGSQRGPSAAAEGPSTSRRCEISASAPNVAFKESKQKHLSVLPHSLHHRTVGRDNTPSVCLKGSEPSSVVQRASELAPDSYRTISERAIALKTAPQQPLTLPGRESGFLSARQKPAPHTPALHGSRRVPVAVDKLNTVRVTETPGLHANSAPEAPLAVEMTLSKNKHSLPALQTAPTLPAPTKSPKFRKTSYTWVANPGKCSRASKRWTASRTPEGTRKLAGGAERTSKLAPRGDSGAKQKKSSPHSKPGVSSSKYKWKASSLQLFPSTSAFTWQREEHGRPGVAHLSGGSSSLPAVSRVPFGHGSPKPTFGNTSFLNYKLKSRTKIIKRRGNASAPAEKRSPSFSTLLLKSRYSLRKRNSPRGKASSPTARKAGAKGLVQIGKHRLRRLPVPRLHVAVKEGSSFLRVTSPPANKVVNTRYRIVKRTVAAPSGGVAASFGSPALGWKTRRLSASRSLVLNRTRQSPPGSKSQVLQHQWRSKGLRCIGGVMYRVSANKLAKTSSSPARGGEPASKIHARAARVDVAHSGPGYASPGCPSRSATSRYIASRAVQRSLAIIRQAKQKKEKKKEYCMYYNRFGKCNRGENCPYIHDPEKVAVCTRFLRGTCKKTDGTCPFSHKVSKDKMPVCSYFLKGICSNSDCPYSHVYVSRKAEVCSDFLKGYCPLGEKCKKKHTLVCPDFSKNGICPKGAQCKLQHPQRKRRARQPSATDSCQHDNSAPKLAHLTEQRVWKEEATPGPSGAEREGSAWSRKALSQTRALSKLPSFISLQSPSTSPIEEEHKPERDKPREETGKPLQIKPRL
ncbi:zinc finger CCCH domain-containing protein 3 [Eublepharis macularius]|uniref:Zinc finger CCCH domain-containing protein 3 n=1 Tax=Eublepharis macularius TaxID=481883 RepID=A0AA97JKM5_EUBMA|nr:zinc finger CCCH domain-containing protein 3 [Eublepharis macularius]